VNNDFAGINQASLNIFFFEEGISREDRFNRVAGSEHIENMLDGNSTTANDRLPTYCQDSHLFGQTSPLSSSGGPHFPRLQTTIETLYRVTSAITLSTSECSHLRRLFADIGDDVDPIRFSIGGGR
jgi:hypothetical protein